MKKYLPYGCQNISRSDLKIVRDVMKSEYLTQGPTIEKFEEIISNYCNVKYSVSVNSATSALHLGCLALGLKEGDILWTSPNSFVASANVGVYCGAKVDFIDINSKSYNIDPNKLEIKLVEAKKNNSLPKILIVVHYAGQSCNMKYIKMLSNIYKFKIIEDASHAMGGEYMGRKIGCCQFSDISVFSFHPVKIITTGEGGVATTNNLKLYQIMKTLRSHGITREKKMMQLAQDGPWHYQQIMLGFNYRITDIQAALGISQMSRIDEFIRKRHSLAKYYNKILKKFPLNIPWQDPNTFSSYHLYPVTIDSKKFSRLDLFNLFRKNNVGVNIHYIPIHLQPFYKKMGFKKGDFPEAEKYYKETITLPLQTKLTRSDQNKVASILSLFFNKGENS